MTRIDFDKIRDTKINLTAVSRETGEIVSSTDLTFQTGCSFISEHVLATLDKYKWTLSIHNEDTPEGKCVSGIFSSFGWTEEAK